MMCVWPVRCTPADVSGHVPAGVRAAAAAHHGPGGGRAPLPEDLDRRQGAWPCACCLHSRQIIVCGILVRC